jgi:glutamate-1-semialdehyde 2,1-aminomutase
MTGFRVHPGGAQALYQVTPDLTTLGKVIGGGLPVGAYGGRRDVMAMVAPAGPVYQAGTLSGNPLAMSAGIATLDALTRPGTWQRAADATATLADQLGDAARAAGAVVQVQQIGAMLTAFFSARPVTDWPTAKACDTGAFARFFQALLKEGIYWVPSQFEAAFPSAVHGPAEIAETVRAAERAFQAAAPRGGPAAAP